MGGQPRYKRDEWLREKYHTERLDTNEMADLARVGASTIRYWMDKHGIERIKNGPKIRPARFFTDHHGYERVEDGKTGKRLPVHRLAAVAWFGWEEVVGRDVHHSNGIKWDTRESNVKPMDHGEHARHHANETKPWEYINV